MKRREFLESAALAALAGGCLSRRRGTHAPAEQETPDVSRREPLRVAVIGAGGQGFINVQRICATGDEIVALCNTICKDVHDKFGIDIHPEVNFI